MIKGYVRHDGASQVSAGFPAPGSDAARRGRAGRSDMRSLRLAVLGGLVWALAPAIGQAATLDVCATACTYTSIQAAVDAAAPGDTIDIQAGTFTGDVDVSVASLTIT